MTEKQTPASRDLTQNPKDLFGALKVSLSKLPPVAMAHAAHAMADGAAKYGAYNWRGKKVLASIYVDAALRHLLAWWERENEAVDSGVHHLGHAIACCAILLDAEETGNLIEDRPPASGAFPRLLERLSGKIKARKAPRKDAGDDCRKQNFRRGEWVYWEYPDEKRTKMYRIVVGPYEHYAPGVAWRVLTPSGNPAWGFSDHLHRCGPGEIVPLSKKEIESARRIQRELAAADFPPEKIPTAPLTASNEEFTPTRAQQEQTEATMFKVGDRVWNKRHSYLSDGPGAWGTVVRVDRAGRYVVRWDDCPTTGEHAVWSASELGCA